MKVSRLWFNQYLGKRLKIEKMIDLLIKLGFGCEIETVTNFGDGLENVFVARISELKYHPHDRHLLIAGLDVGRDKAQVVTAAHNVKVADLVLLARPGSRIMGAEVGEKDFAGIVSQGMFVSEQELGLGGKSEGVIVLEREHHDPSGRVVRVRPGQRFADIFDAEVLDLETTAVRADWWSVLGIARELGRMFEQVMPPGHLPREKNVDLGIVVKDRKGCPLYTGRLVEGVTVRESPFWMKWRLHTHGINPINSVVDATNLVMLQFGQPLHVFDYERLAGGASGSGKKIVVRRARPGEVFVTLDGTRLELKDQLMICDADRPVALAGVVGGLESGINQNTKTVLIESAYFDPILVSRTSKVLNVRTESSIRFEKGVDFIGVEAASFVTGQMLAYYAGGRPSAYQKVGRVPSPRRMAVSFERVKNLLSIDISRAEFVRILKNLELAPKGAENISLRDTVVRITVPSYRNDLKWEADIAEEVARMYGYDRIPEKVSPRPVFEYKHDEMSALEARVKAYMVGKGFDECCSLSLVSEQDLVNLGQTEFLRVKNPLSERYNALRPTLLVNLLNNLDTNLARSNLDLRLFEVGRVFIPSGEKLPREVVYLGAVCGGSDSPLFWEEGRDYDFYDAKGFVSGLFEMLGMGNVAYHPTSFKYFKDGRSARIVIDNKIIGCIGLLDLPSAARSYYYFDVNLDEVLARIQGAIFMPLPKYPVVTRDLSFLVDAGMPAANLLAVVKKAAGPLLKDLQMFDCFSGGNLPQGKKNLGFRLVFRSEERTLKDEDVDRIIHHIEKTAFERTGAALRKA